MAEIKDAPGNPDKKVDKAIEKALRYVGGLAERYAKETISDMRAVDTGFLRNSITWALDGEPANISGYHDDPGIQHGKYEGSAQKEGDGTRSVYIGTNIYYAPYVEFGTTRMRERPFLRNALQNHKEEYERLFKEAFSNFL